MLLRNWIGVVGGSIGVFVSIYYIYVGVMKGFGGSRFSFMEFAFHTQPMDRSSGQQLVGTGILGLGISIGLLIYGFLR